VDNRDHFLTNKATIIKKDIIHVSKNKKKMADKFNKKNEFDVSLPKKIYKKNVTHASSVK